MASLALEGEYLCPREAIRSEHGNKIYREWVQAISMQSGRLQSSYFAFHKDQMRVWGIGDKAVNALNG